MHLFTSSSCTLHKGLERRWGGHQGIYFLVVSDVAGQEVRLKHTEPAGCL